MSSSSPSDNRNFVTLTSSSGDGGGLSKGQRVSPMQRPSKTEVFNRRSHSSESRSITSSDNNKKRFNRYGLKMNFSSSWPQVKLGHRKDCRCAMLRKQMSSVESTDPTRLTLMKGHFVRHYRYNLGLLVT